MNSLLEKLEALEPKYRWMICGLAVVLLVGIGYYLHSMNAESFETLELAVEEMRQSVKHQPLPLTVLTSLKRVWSRSMKRSRWPSPSCRRRARSRNC